MRAYRQLLIFAALAFVALMMCCPEVVLAQADAPPQPSIRQAPPKWLGFLVMVVLVVPILFLSLMPSKRSHQD